MLTAKIDARPTANLLTLRAQLYREDGLFDKAKADVKSALKLDPSFAPALSLQEKLPVENR
jgi:uncharacterized membrane-anchored protein